MNYRVIGPNCILYILGISLPIQIVTSMKISRVLPALILGLAMVSENADSQDLIQAGPEQWDRLASQPVARYTEISLNHNPLLDQYDVKFYGLDVEANNQSDHIAGKTTILLEAIASPLTTILLELYSGLRVERVLVDGSEISFDHSGDELTMSLTEPIDSGQLASVTVYYAGNTGEGMITETDRNWDVPVTYTLSEPFYAKDWFPCKENLGDKADSVHVFITTDYGLMGVSQGLHTGTTYFPNGKVRYEWKSNYPTAFYLISIAIADYQEYSFSVTPGSSADPILVQNFVYDLPGCLEEYRDKINVTIPIMEVFTDLFGPYPFREEKYGHYLWPWGGGMEHQTLSGMGNFEFYLIAHELGHSWFGDYVTCATWQDIWINEGFATYAGHLATEYLGPEFAPGERAYWFNRALNEPEGRVFVPAQEATSDPRIFSGNLSYGKGMALVHMIRFELQNDNLFFQILREFVSRYANDVATGMQFKALLEELSGMDFTDFFDQWYFGPGYPIYDLTWQQEGNLLTLISDQTSSSASGGLFKMSMEYQIFYPGGDTTVRVFHEKSSETYQFNLAYPVESVVIDPNNNVLNQVDQVIQIPSAKKGAESRFFVYPNPVRDKFLFRLGNAEVKLGEDVQIRIYTTSGRQIFSRIYEGCTPFQAYEISMEEVPRGLYLIRFDSGDHVEYKKVLKE